MGSRNRKILIPLLALLLFGCGIYSFRGSIPDHLSDLQVEVFDNRTTEFAVENDLEEALTERLISERLLPLSTREKADCVIRGSINTIQDKPYIFDESENVLEYRLEFKGKVVWYDNLRERELFNKPYSVFGTYFSDTKNASLGGDAQRTRETAYGEGLDLLVDFIIEAMTEEW